MNGDAAMDGGKNIKYLSFIFNEEEQELDFQEKT